MVLRGQPVGEQGAADRWTALDPHLAGSGAGAPRGDPSAAPPSFFLFLHMNPQGPAGFKSRRLAAQFSAYRTKCVSALGASAQVDAPFSAV